MTILNIFTHTHVFISIVCDPRLTWESNLFARKGEGDCSQKGVVVIVMDLPNAARSRTNCFFSASGREEKVMSGMVFGSVSMVEFAFEKNHLAPAFAPSGRERPNTRT